MLFHTLSAIALSFFIPLVVADDVASLMVYRKGPAPVCVTKTQAGDVLNMNYVRASFFAISFVSY